MQARHRLCQTGLTSCVLNNIKRHLSRSIVPNTMGQGPPDYASFFSRTSLARLPSPIRELQPLVTLPGMISLGGGMPNPHTFPIEGVTLQVKGISPLELSASEIETALQYSPTPGLPDLCKFLFDLQQREHKPPREVVTTVCTGSQEGLSRAFSMLLGSEDTLLLENPTYSGSLAYLKPLGCKLECIETDQMGLIPASLRTRLDSWTSNMGRKPRVLYTIPTGANPTGGTMNKERRLEVYSIAQKHDLLVIEDDPYYYLQFYDKRLPSLLSIDVDGRVLRFDSFSKLISSGLRLGFATGAPMLLERLNMHTQVESMTVPGLVDAVNLHPSGISQAVVLKLLQAWGPIGFEEHVKQTTEFYRGQRDAFIAAATKHLTGKAEWTKPEAGMFVWLKLVNIEDTFKLITEKAIMEKVILVPGMAFDPDRRKSSWVRAAYSTATPEQMDEACRRLASIL